jgi:hypothetical protein
MAKKIVITVYDGFYIEDVIIKSCKTFKQLDGQNVKVNNAIISFHGTIKEVKETEI